MSVPRFDGLEGSGWHIRIAARICAAVGLAKMLPETYAERKAGPTKPANIGSLCRCQKPNCACSFWGRERSCNILSAAAEPNGRDMVLPERRQVAPVDDLVGFLVREGGVLEG